MVLVLNLDTTNIPLQMDHFARKQKPVKNLNAQMNAMKYTLKSLMYFTGRKVENFPQSRLLHAIFLDDKEVRKLKFVNKNYA